MVIHLLWKKAAIIIGILLSGFFLVNVLAKSFKPQPIKLTRLFPNTLNSATVKFDHSIIANPLLFSNQGIKLILVPESNGTITAINTESSKKEWQLSLVQAQCHSVLLAATPVRVANKLVVVYQCIDKGIRTSHQLGVIDLSQHQLDPAFPVLTLTAQKPTADGKSVVTFNPPHAFSHAALKHVAQARSVWGKLYVAFGNAGDTQPFHGWVFEIDMNEWQSSQRNNPIKNVLLTTPEAECPVTIESGTQEMVCGGGVWTPAGPQIYPAGTSYELLLPVGNGQIDLARHDYANTLMRVKPGLLFDPGCDDWFCKNFNPNQPSEACMASCKNLFIPRLNKGDAPLKPANGDCDNKSFWECLAWMDYDLGANAPVKVQLSNGQSVIVQAGKEGGVYLIDAEHLGKQYDRLQIVDSCGTPQDPCKAGWMGMIVTQPVVTYVNHQPVVIIPSFVPDKTHPAGIIALKIVLENGQPKFRRFWQFPSTTSSKATQKFRSHPSLPVITTLAKSGDAIVWVIDTGNPGTLYGIRVKDGSLLVRQALLGTGRQLTAPVIHQDTLYLVSTMPNTGQSFIEAYRLNRANNEGY
jgi:hypothetical protein